MGITQINTTDKVGGAAKVAYELYKSATKEKFNSFMYVGLKTSEDFNIKNINPIYNFLMHIPILRRYAREYINLEKFSNIDWQKILEEDSLIHFHNIHGGYFDINNLKLLKGLNKKIIWTLHDMWLITANEAHTNEDYWQEKNFNILDAGKREILEKRRKILDDLDITYVLPSNWLKENFKKSFLNKKPYVVINNGADTDSFFKENKSIAKEELGIPKDKRVVLFVAQGGRNNRWKGGDIWEYVVDQLSKIRDDILFVELGRTKSDVFESERYLSAAYTEDIEKLRMYYNAADILCFPSKAENYSLVLLESLACGLPVLCFDVGGNKEIITNQKNGYVVKEIESKTYLGRMVEMLEDKEKLEEMSKNNILKASNLNLENTVKKYLQLYKSL